MSAPLIAEVAQIDLEGFQGVKSGVDGVYLLQPVLERRYHLILFRENELGRREDEGAG
jgi:hypothetical protein